MDKEKDFFKTCFNTVAGIEVKNESQAIAKEVVLSEIENLQQENKRLKDNWNYIKKMLKEARQEEFNIIGYCGTCTDVDIDFLLSKIEEMENQQKEVIEYLEDEIKQINPKELDIGELNLRLDDIKFTQYLIYKEILQKYKEIIGDNK